MKYCPICGMSLVWIQYDPANPRDPRARRLQRRPICLAVHEPAEPELEPEASPA